MRKVNTGDLEELTWTSPKGTFGAAGKQVSEALGRKPHATDVNERHPFDVEISRIPPGATPYPYHAHTAQWEFYHVIAGTGLARHDGGTTRIAAGDAFIFRPGEAHTFTNDGAADLVMYVVADNPFADAGWFPDSGKWMVGFPGAKKLLRSEPLDYYDGEE
jgi:mannose-6-phosphate isomerase-like protein (cupin superfamily)